MGSIEVLVTALALSVDAFVCSVISGKKRMDRTSRLLTGLTIAFAFGLFQALMPVIGFLAGSTLQQHFSDYDHWIAFLLLAGVSLNMLKEVFSKEDHNETAEKLIPESCKKCATDGTKTQEHCAVCTKVPADQRPEWVCPKRIQIGFIALIALAVGTSIDALAVGVSVGLISNTIMAAAITIGVVCALCSLSGFYLGQILSMFRRLDPVLNCTGAIVLMAIAVKILFEHQVLTGML